MDDNNEGPLIYILITGAAPSVTAVRIEVNYVIEFTPKSANYIYCNVD